MAKIYNFDAYSEGGPMYKVTVFDVAKVFLSMDTMTHKKLQKLCYYAQAWHWALFGKELFLNDFQAWVHGPVCPELYSHYKVYGWNNIPRELNLPSDIKDETLEFIEEVYNTYHEFSGDELENLTHMEQPWREARKGLEDWQPSDRVIDTNLMRSYYNSVYEAAQND